MSELMKESHEKYLKKVRERVWYKRYKSIADLLKEGKCENPVDVLKNIDTMINDCRGYGYEHLANSAYQSLKQVIKDMGW